MYQIIGIEFINKPATYNRRAVKGIRVHCFDLSTKIEQGMAVTKFFFPDRSGKTNRAAKLKLDDYIESIYYDQDKYPISYDLAESVE